MTQAQATALVWTVYPMIYGFGVWMIDERWFTVVGAMMFAILAIFQNIWAPMMAKDAAAA